MKRDTGVVLGGSVAGMVAAKVLTKYFKKVYLIEQDAYPKTSEVRKGVAQAHHLHVFLQRGQNILENQFPGIIDEFARNGAPTVDAGEKLIFKTMGGWLPRKSFGVRLLPASRNLIDWTIIQYLRREKNLEILEDTPVTGMSLRGEQVVVQLGEREMAADLIVDATGRRSKTMDWLEEFGFARPRETVVNSFLGYASRVYERPQVDMGCLGVGVQANPPLNHRGGIIMPIENNRWMVTLGGGNKVYPPADEEGFLKFADDLGSERFSWALRQAKPLGKIYLYRATENRWKHFEELSNFPKNLIMIGDAACAFNPVYGQGMTMASFGGNLLDQCLKGNFSARGFQKKLAKQNEVAWLTATSEDFRYPLTEGKRPGPSLKFMHNYMDRVQMLAAVDYPTACTFYRVVHMLDQPIALFSPRIIWKILTNRRRGLLSDPIGPLPPVEVSKGATNRSTPPEAPLSTLA